MPDQHPGRNRAKPSAVRSRANTVSGRRTSKHPPQNKGVLHFIGLGLSAALLVVMAATAALIIVIPAVVGGQPLTVLTNSMAPELPPGTLVVIKPTPIEEIAINDVLTYQITSGEPALISHRVITRSMSNTGITTFLTKGDNNAAADTDPVQEIQIVGTVWYSFPLLGFVNNAINGEARTWLAPIVAGLLFVYGGSMVASAIAGRQRRKKRERDRASRQRESVGT